MTTRSGGDCSESVLGMGGYCWSYGNLLGNRVEAFNGLDFMVGHISSDFFILFVLIKATENVPVATAYAVFTGIGTAGTSLVDMIVFEEPFIWTKMLFLLLLLIGVIGLKLVTAESSEKEDGI